MNTPTHMVIGVALRRGALDRRLRENIPLSAVLWGSLAPDVALFLLSLGGWVYFVPILGWSSGEAFSHMWSELFYTDPFWIFAHNLFQAPPLLLGTGGLLWLLGRRGDRVADDQSGGARLAATTDDGWRRWLSYFVAAATLHTALDIPTHHNDGPLLLFPFDWELRFSSPVSYWDPEHYGLVFMVFECALLLALSAYLLLRWRRRSGAEDKSSSALRGL